MNATAFWSSQIFPPRAHGSGAAPLAELLISGHKGRIEELTREERDLLLAWIDTNGLYHGTWDATAAGCAIPHWEETRAALVDEMRAADCMQCHGDNEGNVRFFENDWINLRNPEHSRILRAPLARGDAGYGLALCRDRKVNPDRQRIHLLRGGYGHAVQPVEAYPKYDIVPPDPSGEPAPPFESTEHPTYRMMLRIIRDARDRALANPRVDMPGAQIIAGACRMFLPPPVPETAPQLSAARNADGAVRLAWELSAETIGLEASLHRGAHPEFAPTDDTLLIQTNLDHYLDVNPPEGPLFYALMLSLDNQASRPSYVAVEASDAQLADVGATVAFNQSLL